LLVADRNYLENSLINARVLSGTTGNLFLNNSKIGENFSNNLKKFWQISQVTKAKFGWIK